MSKINVDDVPDHDLFTYSFPCTSVSLAGKQQGFEKGSGTASSLLWECERVIQAKKPKYLLLENVKNLVGKKFIDGFNEWLKVLEDLGYTNYWQVLNAKDYGVPQNRERVFVVSILGEHKPYQFPEKEPLLIRLKDILESEVDEKFYLSDEQVSKIKLSTFRTSNARIQEKDYSDTLCARDYKDPKCVQVETPKIIQRPRGYNKGGEHEISPTISSHSWQENNYLKDPQIKQVGNMYDTDSFDGNPQCGRIYSSDGISPALNTMQGGNRQPKVIEPQIAASRGRYDENGNVQQNLEVNLTGCSNTITTVQKDNYVLEGVDVHPTSKKLEFGGFAQKEISPCLLATDYKAPKTILESIPIKEVTKKGYSEARDGDYVNISHPSSKTRRGRVGRGVANTLLTNDQQAVVELKPSVIGGVGEKIFGKQYRQGDRIYDVEKTSPCLMSHPVGNTGGQTYLYGSSSNSQFRIRKLTPKECWRLMGFTDEDFDKASKVNSNSQLYKQAGNSIVVPVLEKIFANLFKK